jgi:hypothetical protein
MLLTELILELERRVRELQGILLRNRELKLENIKSRNEITALEQEMKETIESYQAMLNTDPNEFAEHQISDIKVNIDKI